MKTTSLVTLMLAGTVVLGGCATSDPYNERYDNSGYGTTTAARASRRQPRY